MSSAPTTPTPVPVATNTALVNDLKWIATHILLLVIIGALTLGGIYEIENLVAKRDAANASKYSALLNTQVQQTQSLQKQLADFEFAEAQRDAEYQKTIAQLSQSIAARNANAAKQQQADQSLDAQSAASRLSQQTNAQPGEVTVQGNTVILDLPITRSVVASLDSLNVLSANLADTQSQLAAQQKLTADAQADATQEKQLVASQQQELIAQKTACDAQVKAAKANGRKSGIKGFLGGMAFVGLLVLGHAL